MTDVNISASVTLHVTVTDTTALWHRAVGVCVDQGLITQITSEGPTVTDDIIEMIGTQDDPDISGCLRMIFDPGDSGPGLTIEESTAEIE